MAHYKYMVALMLVCLLFVSTSSGLPVRETNSRREPKSEGVQLKAHMNAGDQPRFAEYPLLYSMGLPRRR